MIVCIIGSAGRIALGCVGSSQPPGVWPVSLEMLRIGNRIRMIDERDVAIVIEIRAGEAVVKTVRIEAHEGVMSKEERTTWAHAHIELDAIVGVSISVVVAVGRARPPGAVLHRHFGLTRPS